MSDLQTGLGSLASFCLDLGADILINVDMTPDKKIHTLNKKFYWNKVATFLASFVKWQTPIRLRGGASVTLSPHQQLMTPCVLLHTFAHILSSCVQLCTIILGPTLNISGDKNHPWPGVRRRSLEITDMVRVALDYAASLRKGLLWKVALTRATSTLTTDAESAGQLSTRPVSSHKCLNLHMSPLPSTVSTLWPSNHTFHHRTETGRPGQVRFWLYRMLLVMISELNTEHWTHRISFHPICKFN